MISELPRLSPSPSPFLWPKSSGKPNPEINIKSAAKFLQPFQIQAVTLALLSNSYQYGQYVHKKCLIQKRKKNLKSAAQFLQPFQIQAVTLALLSNWYQCGQCVHE